MFYETKMLIVRIFYDLKTFLGNDTGKCFSNVKSGLFYVAFMYQENETIT